MTRDTSTFWKAKNRGRDRTVPLRVALVHGNKRSKGANRVDGLFSYAVPEFTWVHIPVGPFEKLDRKALANRGYDLAVWEDDMAYGGFSGSPEDLPVVYMVEDSTVNPTHFRVRYGCSRQADLILVDSDSLDRFYGHGAPIFRLNYCINDQIARDYGAGKTIDVSFHASMKDIVPRRVVQQALTEHCKQRGYSLAIGRIPDRVEYMRAFSRSKVSVHVTSVTGTRAHRPFDVMGCQSALLSSRLPPVSGDLIEPMVHYVPFDDAAEMCQRIDWMLENDRWQGFAAAGQDLVLEQHTWSRRATQLRDIIRQELGL